MKKKPEQNLVNAEEIKQDSKAMEKLKYEVAQEMSLGLQTKNKKS